MSYDMFGEMEKMEAIKSPEKSSVYTRTSIVLTFEQVAALDRYVRELNKYKTRGRRVTRHSLMKEAVLDIIKIKEEEL